MTKLKKSPFAPPELASLLPIDGFKMATAETGIKYKNRTDLWVVYGCPGTQIAGVFTKNLCPGYPVVWSKEAITVKNEGPRLLLVNSGVANVFGGQKGKDAIAKIAESCERVFDVKSKSVIFASTGVIGEALDASKIISHLPDINKNLFDDGWLSGAEAIMTTDTYPKVSTASAVINGISVKINGIAKGSGMIAPDMATMLSFIATDANLSQSVLQSLLNSNVQDTFNSITVDSDTSTSDTLLLMASCTAHHDKVNDPLDPSLESFIKALRSVLKDLALQVVKDGEGISKFIKIKIKGAVSNSSAKAIGLSIANSPLVKTAIAGEDANWGRVVMAVGKSGEPAERDKLSISIGPYIIAEGGDISKDYDEDKISMYMQSPDINLEVDLGLGDGKAKIYTCDLTHDYISINADYRS
jgi:glutamate N-acetyltransferase/amino-acid N-acetyltransferase